MKLPTKILYPIGTYYPSQEGGPSNSVYWMCTGLRKHHEVETTVITTKGGIDLNQIELDKWYKTGNNKVNYTNSKGLLPLKMLLTSIRHLNQADILHLTSIFYPPSIILLVVNTLFYRKKVVASVRGELDKYVLKNYRPKLKKVLLLIWKSQKNKIHFHCTVKEEENYTKAIFGSNTKTITLPNFIEFNNDSNNNKHNLDYFLFLGRLHPKKGIDNMLKALKQSLSFNNSKYVVKIAGSGDDNYVNSLKYAVKNLNLQSKVEFLGHVEGEEKNRLLGEAYFLIFPSFTENFGNVVVEALVNETPVIASKGTPWEKLVDNNAGLWVNNDVDNLSKSIDKVIGMSNKQYAIMSENAFNLADKEFNVYNNSHKWVDFYKKL